MTESHGLPSDDEESLPGELPFDQELDFSKEFSDDDYALDIWDEESDENDIESDDDY